MAENRCGIHQQLLEDLLQGQAEQRQLLAEIDGLLRGSRDGSKPGLLQRIDTMEDRFKLAAWVVGILMTGVVAMVFDWVRGWWSKG